MILEPNPAIEVVLEWYEIEVIKGVAQLRHDESIRNSKTAQLRRDLDADYVGAMGEMAFAKATNRYWQAEVNAKGRTGGDVGHIEVRTSRRKDASLIVRSYDVPHKIYALIVCLEPKCYFVGWCHGKFARQQQFLREMPSGDQYVVPQWALNAPELLGTIDGSWRILRNG